MEVQGKQIHPREYFNNLFNLYIYIHLHVLPEVLVTDLLAGD